MYLKTFLFLCGLGLVLLYCDQRYGINFLQLDDGTTDTNNNFSLRGLSNSMGTTVEVKCPNNNNKNDNDDASKKESSSSSTPEESSSSSFESLASKLVYVATDPWKETLFKRLDAVRAKCGPLCGINSIEDYNSKGTTTTNNNEEEYHYKTFQTPVDCRQLFELEEIDASDTTVPYPIPPELVDLYSLGGSIEIEYWQRFVNVYLGAKAAHNVWTVQTIQTNIRLIERGELAGTYNANETTMVRNKLKEYSDRAIKGKSVLVVGSETPWLESIALWAGAAHVTTLEYGTIESQHPQISTITPMEFRQQYLKGDKTPKYDMVLSHSSLEHSGLGRYGDAMNPWGDILSLARCWCVTKPQGLLMMSVPVGPDKVSFNAHRVYGNIRYPLLTQNWKPIDGTTTFDPALDSNEDARKESAYELRVHGYYQPPHFFQKVEQVPPNPQRQEDTA